MKLLPIKIFCCSILCLFGIGIWMSASAATLSIKPLYDEMYIGETFTAEIHLDSEDTVINTVQGSLQYPTDLLKVVSISKAGSFLTLWAQEPAHEPSAGVISFAGGIPNGSYVVDGKVVSITFTAKAPGGAEIIFDTNNSSVHLNDGFGTPTPLTVKPGVISIADKKLITILSPTHPDENTWYARDAFTAEWSYDDNAQYSYTLSQDSDELPDTNEDFGEGIVTYQDLESGIYYFVLSSKSPDGTSWEVIGKRQVLIDIDAPRISNTRVTSDPTLFAGQYILLFSATDKDSGIDFYEVEDNDTIFSPVDSPYVLSDQTLTKRFVVRAYDHAGNSARAVVIAGSDDDGPFFMSATYFLIILILTAILCLLWLLFRLYAKH